MGCRVPLRSSLGHPLGACDAACGWRPRRRVVSVRGRAAPRRAPSAPRTRRAAPLPDSALASATPAGRAGDREQPEQQRVAAARRCRSGPGGRCPTSATGTIASSEVASAWCWPRPRKNTSPGTNSTPPPTPSRPATTPAGEPDRDRADHRSTSSTALATSTAANSSAIARRAQALLQPRPISTPPTAGHADEQPRRATRTLP